VAPQRVEDDDDKAIDGGRGPGGAPRGYVGLRREVVAAAVEVELGAGEEEATGEEVYCQRVDREDRDEQQRPAKEPRTAAVARRRRHHLRFRSGDWWRAAERRRGDGWIAKWASALLSPGCLREGESQRWANHHRTLKLGCLIAKSPFSAQFKDLRKLFSWT